MLLVGVTGVFLARGATLALNLAVMPRLRPAPPRPCTPTVSLLVPARDEEENLRGLLPALAVQGADEIIVFDDGLNGTGLDEAEALGVQVISSPRPEGWVGRNWPLWELTRAASGRVLVITDADTVWEEDTLDAALASRQQLGADLLTVLPSMRGLTAGTRLLSPLTENIVLTLAPWPLLSWDRLGLGAGSGALMMLDRETYVATGGHRAIAGVIQDDMELARAVQRTRVPVGVARGVDGRGGDVQGGDVQGGGAQQAGAQERRGRTRLVLGGRLFGVRNYRSYRDSVQGFGKSAVALHGGSRAATVLTVVGFGLTHLAVWFQRPSPWVWAVRAAGVADRGLVAAVTGRRGPADLAEGLLGPVTPLLAVPALVVALRRRVRWKSRDHPVRDPVRDPGRYPVR